MLRVLLLAVMALSLSLVSLTKTLKELLESLSLEKVIDLGSESVILDTGLLLVLEADSTLLLKKDFSYSLSAVRFKSLPPLVSKLALKNTNLSATVRPTRSTVTLVLLNHLELHALAVVKKKIFLRYAPRYTDLSATVRLTRSTPTLVKP